MNHSVGQAVAALKIHLECLLKIHVLFLQLDLLIQHFQAQSPAMHVSNKPPSGFQVDSGFAHERVLDGVLERR